MDGKRAFRCGDGLTRRVRIITPPPSHRALASGQARRGGKRARETDGPAKTHPAVSVSPVCSPYLLRSNARERHATSPLPRAGFDVSKAALVDMVLGAANQGTLQGERWAGAGFNNQQDPTRNEILAARSS